jgi:large subunit ribosomal protein L22
MATPETREVKAQAKWVRTSPRKARVVAEHIRGRSVPEARSVLAFTPRAAAREIEKVLRSAVANAEANHGLLGEDLVVRAAFVDDGPTLKRWRARARGRVARIRKRTCHITVLLVPSPESLERRSRRGAQTADESKRRLPTPRRGARKQAEPEAAVVEEAVVETDPDTEVPAAEEAVETPEPEAAAPAEAETEPEPPKRRRTVRRKKTDETSAESPQAAPGEEEQES